MEMVFLLCGVFACALPTGWTQQSCAYRSHIGRVSFHEFACVVSNTYNVFHKVDTKSLKVCGIWKAQACS